MLAGHGGTALLAVIWSLAAASIVLQTFGTLTRPRLSAPLYLAMEWTVLADARPLIELLPANRPDLTVWPRGLCYTGGTILSCWDSRLKLAHPMWHVFVLAGSACQFVAIA